MSRSLTRISHVALSLLLTAAVAHADAWDDAVAPAQAWFSKGLVTLGGLATVTGGFFLTVAGLKRKGALALGDASAVARHNESIQNILVNTAIIGGAPLLIGLALAVFK